MAKITSMRIRRRFGRLATGVPLLVIMVGMATYGAGARAATTDPLFPSQWALEKIGAERAWARGGGEGVTVAVVDSGVHLGHEDLAGKIVAQVSCIGADDDHSQCSGSAQDDHGHGTHVAGIAAAVTGNGKGVAGTAPGADLMAVRVLERDATGDAVGNLADVRAGIRWAVDHGADVINLSLGENVLIRNLFGSGLEPAIDYAWERGVVVSVAAGNTPGLFPAGYGGLDALVVTATDIDDEQASYATDTGGAKWGVAAPGGDGAEDATQIVSTWWEESASNTYHYASGTSMAAPHVSGAIALLLSLGLSPEEAIDRLLETAVDLGPKGNDSDFGHGRVDVAAATEGFGRPAPPPPPPPTTLPEVSEVTAPAPSAPPASVAGRMVEAPSPPPEITTSTAPAAPPDTAPPTETAVADPRPEPESSGRAPWLITAGFALAAAAAGARGAARARFSPPARSRG